MIQKLTLWMLGNNDKVYHFLLGLLIQLSVGVFNPTAGLACSFVAGGGKEVYDRVSGKGAPDVKDMYATWLGGFVGWVFQLGAKYMSFSFTFYPF